MLIMMIDINYCFDCVDGGDYLFSEHYNDRSYDDENCCYSFSDGLRAESEPYSHTTLPVKSESKTWRPLSTVKV